MKTLKRALAGAAAALMLTACGAGGVTSGEVVDKEYVEAHVTEEEQDVTEEDCDYVTKKVNGKSKKVKDCDTEVVGTEIVEVEHPDKWTLTLENKDGETGEVEVSEEEYNSVEVGDQFDSEG